MTERDSKISVVAGAPANPQEVVENIRSALSYSPDSGEFIWRRDILGGQGAITRAAGSVAGAYDTHGYRIVSFAGRKYRAARLAWLLMTGVWPRVLIDHINGVKNDDRWSNLREGDKSLNGHNIRRPNCCNTTGFRGIKRSGNNFTAHIIVKGRPLHLGSFASPEEAHAAYIEAKRKHVPGVFA